MSLVIPATLPVSESDVRRPDYSNYPSARMEHWPLRQETKVESTLAVGRVWELFQHQCRADKLFFFKVRQAEPQLLKNRTHPRIFNHGLGDHPAQSFIACIAH